MTATGTPTSGMAEVALFVRRVEEHLEQVIDTEESCLRALGLCELESLVQALRQLVLSAGKRVRPMFCYWGWRAAGPERRDDGQEHLVLAGTVLELVHTCALVHDDVMDGSDWRRGQPSLHQSLAEWHRVRGLAGDPSRFGTSGSLLAGHLCLAWADRLLDGLPTRLARAARPICAQLRLDATAGQYLDLLAEVGVADRSLAACLRLAQLKTGSYTVERPMELGGVMGGATPGLLATYRAYGRALGVAFQLADDIADAFGDPAQDGRQGGEDLRAGKATVLLALARSEASIAQRRVLDDLVGRSDLTSLDIESVRNVLVDTGALNRSAELVAHYVAEAKAVIENADISETSAAALVNLADAVGRA